MIFRFSAHATTGITIGKKYATCLPSLQKRKGYRLATPYLFVIFRHPEFDPLRVDLYYTVVIISCAYFFAILLSF